MDCVRYSLREGVDVFALETLTYFCFIVTFFCSNTIHHSIKNIWKLPHYVIKCNKDEFHSFPMGTKQIQCFSLKKLYNQFESFIIF